MKSSRRRVVLMLALAMSSAAGAQEHMQIYRCVDAKGTVSLRDSPCGPNETEEIRQVRIPRSPPPVRPTEPIMVEEPAAPRQTQEVRVVIVQPARPMYECTTPEGNVYTSDDGDGNPRWVPIWTLGYPNFGRPSGHHRPPSVGRPPPGGPPPGGRPPPPPYGWPMVIGSGTYIRDECRPLPQREICRRLSDRRYEILRRYGVVSPSEHRALDREQQTIDERMANDCPGY